MVEIGKIKYDNNYWMDMMDGTWANYCVYYDVVSYSIDGYNATHIYRVKQQELISRDNGKTSEVESETVFANQPVHASFVNSNDIMESINNSLNINRDKAITWIEPLHEVASGMADIKKYLLSDVFKVGYVWTSYTNTSPAKILGGTWTEMKGVFPYYNASTATGGSNTHKLSSGEMPTHKHDARIHITGSEAKGYGLAQNAGFKDRVVVAYGGYGYYTGDTGGNGSHNNMPKYQSLYAWRRTA